MRAGRRLRSSSCLTPIRITEARGYARARKPRPGHLFQLRLGSLQRAAQQGDFPRELLHVGHMEGIHIGPRSQGIRLPGRLSDPLLVHVRWGRVPLRIGRSVGPAESLHPLANHLQFCQEALSRSFAERP